MKKILLITLALTCFFWGYSQQVAFPGAEGFGKYSSGGRGGIVVEVTNLSDAGTGSLRDALTGTAYRNKPRTIVFRVSGIIELQSPISVSNDAHITIAGQTAPGDGICLKNYTLKMSNCNNIIVRYLRFRPGDKQNCTACDDIDAHSYRNSYHIIVDHCSMSWSIDDILDLTVTTGWSTIQWCILSEPLVNSKHSKGAHGYIAGWDGNNMADGRGFGGGSYHHNLLAHGGSRTPRLDKAGENGMRDLMDVVNNVIYNNGGLGAYGGEAADVNWQNNYYKDGVNTDATLRSIIFHASDSCRMYVNGNYIYRSESVTKDNSRGIDTKYSLYTVPEIVQSAPYPAIEINMESARDAYNSVLSFAGAILPQRDACDLRIVKDVINRTGEHIDSPDEVGGWPVFVPQSRGDDYDTDHDGMPNFWEKYVGLDTNDVSDGNTVAADGYTMLEKYLNAIEFSLPVNNLQLHKTTESGIIVSWDDTFFSEEGFIIERSVNNGGFVELAEVGENETSYTDTDVNSGDSYSYRIKAKTSYWESGYSAIRSTGGLPGVVSYINPEQNGVFVDDTVTFRWDPSDGATGYDLYFGTKSDSLFKLTSTSETKYFYYNTIEGEGFYWRVDALSDSGSVQGPVWSFAPKVSASREYGQELGARIYPNPASGKVYVEWESKSGSPARIEIIDIDGRIVKQLEPGKYAAGIHIVTWDGTSNNGCNVPAGIYFCRLSVDNTTQVLRINRVK